MTYVPTNRGLSLDAAAPRRTRGKSGDRRLDRARTVQAVEPDQRCDGPCATNRPARQFPYVVTATGPVRSSTCRSCTALGATLHP